MALEAVAVAGLTRLGSVSRWRVDWAHLWTWLQQAPTEDAVVGVVRWLALALAWWLLASSVLYSLARASRIPGLIRGTRWLTLPVVRSVVDRALVVTLAASTVVGARGGVALAQTAGGGAALPRAVATAAPAPGWGGDRGTPAVQESQAAVPAAPQLRSVELIAAATPADLGDQLAPAATWDVVKDDNLWSICTRHLAEVTGRTPSSLRAGEIATYWWAVVDANRSTIRSGNPNLIYAGEVVQLLPVLSTPDGYAAGSSASPASPPAARATAPAAAAPAPVEPSTPPAASPSAAAPTAATTAPATTAAPTTAPATTTATTAPATTAPAPPTTGANLAGVPAPAPPSTSRASGSPASATPVTTAAARPGMALPAPDPGAPRPSVAPPSTATGDAADVEAQPRAAARGSGWSLSRDFPVRLDGPGLLGAALLGAGVLGTLDRMRRRQRRRGRLLLPDVELAGRELALRVGADPGGAAFVDVALRAMAARLRTSGEAVPDVLGVELGPSELSVLIDAAAGPPEGFTARDGGRRWVLSRGAADAVAALEELAEGVPTPCPGLVSVGRTARGVLLLDLEQASLTTAVGDAEGSRAVLAAAAVELATSPWADFVSVVLVGFGEELAGLERVRVVGSVAEVIDELEATAAEIAAVLEDGGCASTIEARVRGEAFDAWVPTMVLCNGRPPARLAKRLAAVATRTGNAGVGVLVAGEMEGAWELVSEGDGLSVGPLGVTVAPHGLAEEETEAIGDLFELAQRENDDEVEDDEVVDDDDEVDEAPRYDGRRVGALNGSSAVGPGAGRVADYGEDDDELAGEEPPGTAPGLPPELAGVEQVQGYEVFVGVMGPPVVWGGARPITRAKALELVAYLALHPRKPINAERLLDVLSPDWRHKDAPGGKRHPAAVTLNTTTTVARGCLGRGADGRLHVPHLQGNGTRIYALHGVGLDYQVFCLLAQQAREAEGRGDLQVAIAALEAALQLVRGVPFEGIFREDDEAKPYQWVFVEGVFYRIESDVRDAAHRLATLHLDAGDAKSAERAVRRGRLACGRSDIALAHDLMRAGGMGRSPGVVEEAMRDLADLVEADEPYDRVDPETVALYREQLARATGRGDAPPAGSNGVRHHPPTLVSR